MFDRAVVANWFDLMYSETPGLLNIVATDNWQGKVYAPDQLDQAVDYVAQLDAEGCQGIYARMTTLTERPRSGRGGAELSLAFPGLWADIDINGPGHATTPIPLPPDPEAAAQIAAAAGLPEPSMWIHSGGGVYPLWLLDVPHVIDGDLEQVAALSAGWQQAIGAAAERLGWHYGTGVGDLARVLRIPGTVNRKEGLQRPCRLLRADGVSFTLPELYAALEAAQAAQPAPAPLAPSLPAPEPRAAGPAGDGTPFDALAAGCTWADILAPSGWTLVGRERDGAELWRRPGDPSSAYSARAGHGGTPTLVVHSDAAGLPSGPGQKLTMGRVFAHLHHGGDEKAAARDIAAAAAGSITASTAARALPAAVLNAVTSNRTAPAPLGVLTPPASATPPKLALVAPAAPSDGQVEDEPEPVRTWAPVDLTAHLDGTFVPEAASLFPRVDGPALLYPGRVHSFHGESESGKSLVAQAECARLLTLGLPVLYLDFESDAAAVVARLLELGAGVEDIRHNFRYVRPESSPRANVLEHEAWVRLLMEPCDLAIVDGVTDALGLHGASSTDNDDVSAFMREVPRQIARRTGAAVVLIDHVSKDSESRGRFAIGGQAKMAALDGAAYMVEVVEVLGRGLLGAVSLRVAKDRPGAVRPHCGPWRKTDRSQEAARVVVDSRTPGRIAVTVGPPQNAAPGTSGERAEFRPTALMDKVSRYVEFAPGSMNAIESGVPGNREAKRKAVRQLVTEGYLTEAAGPRGARIFTSARPYREADDIGSDRALTPLAAALGATSPDLAPLRPSIDGARSSATSPTTPLPYGGWARSASPQGEQKTPDLAQPARAKSPQPPQRAVCLGCGDLLDPWLADRGAVTHVGCEGENAA
ncbi:AAA family ATPase [Longispora albida]|uniref:AAA family ATPase n=1 Tax=Longispora albida TaxID=203523 RepID=UPI0003629CC7|nr:AAA family ATPase [Longispora albida]